MYEASDVYKDEYWDKTCDFSRELLVTTHKNWSPPKAGRSNLKAHEMISTDHW